METYKAITTSISGTAGVPFTTISELKNVRHLQAYDDQHALILSGTSGAMDLRPRSPCRSLFESDRKIRARRTASVSWRSCGERFHSTRPRSF